METGLHFMLHSHFTNTEPAQLRLELRNHDEVLGTAYHCGCSLSGAAQLALNISFILKYKDIVMCCRKLKDLKIWQPGGV